MTDYEGLLRHQDDNQDIMEFFSALLCEKPYPFTEAEILSFARDTGMPAAEAYPCLLAALCGMRIDENPRHYRLYEQYWLKAIRPMDASVYREDDYYRHIRFPNRALGRWKAETLEYRPYELFCCNEPDDLPDGREIPRIGYFTESFSYPALSEEGRLWMAVTPNEVETMRNDIAAAHGKTAVFGLGLGYYAYYAARAVNVSSVSVIERDPDAIALFEQYLLPQFIHPEKIRVIRADAFDYFEHILPKEHFDFAYLDLWHDVSDGVDMYLRFRRMTADSHCEYRYWIEKSMLQWIRSLALGEKTDDCGKLYPFLRSVGFGDWSLNGFAEIAPLIPYECVRP